MPRQARAHGWSITWLTIRHNQRPAQQQYRATVLCCLIAFSDGCNGPQVSVVVLSGVHRITKSAMNEQMEHKEDPAVTLPPSNIPLPPAMVSDQAPRHGRLLARLSGGFAIAAVVIGLGWGPVMLIIAHLLRPPQLDGGPYRGDIGSLRQAAETRMWIILIASFLIILALVWLAIVLGRGALRIAGSGTESDKAVARLRKWGGICLTVSLLGLGYIGLAGGFWATFKGPAFPSYVYTYNQWILVLLIASTVLGAMGSFILNGIAARKTSARTWVGAVVSALVILLWFLFVAGAAQLLVSFFLHYVW